MPAIVRAAGARCWTQHGDVYIDFDNRGGAVLLGHDDPDVAVAVRRAETLGAEALATALTERLTAMAPHAEAALYGADVAECMAAALAGARAATGRPLAFACDSCAWRAVAGLPAFAFDDIAALERLLADQGHRTAALVLAPLGARAPAAGYLAAVRRLADAHGVALILDETLSGFRVHAGGAQGLYGVRADLALFGDSLANGAPFAAVAGRRDLLKAAAAAPLTPSASALAAAAAVLDKIDRHGVVACLRVRGAEVQAEVSAAIEAAGAGHVVQMAGDPAASTLAFTACGPVDPLSLKRFWIREAAGRGLISLAAHNMSYAHGEAEIEALIGASRQIAARLMDALDRDAAAPRPNRPASRPPFTVQ